MSGRFRSGATKPEDAGIVRFVYLENRDGGSSKYYTVVVEADPAAAGSHRCRAEWGRIGTSTPSEQVKQTGDVARCERSLDDLVREKQGRGYRLVRDERPTAPTVADPPRPVRAKVEERLDEALARRKREAEWSF